MVPELTISQMKAMADPLRWKVVSTLRGLGEASVAELAESVGSPVSTLYYPLRILVDSGLVLVSDRRYRLSSPRFYLNPSAPLEIREKLTRAMTKALERELLGSRDRTIVRSALWLGAADLDEFRERQEALVREFEGRSRRGEGALVYWTGLLVEV